MNYRDWLNWWRYSYKINSRARVLSVESSAIQQTIKIMDKNSPHKGSQTFPCISTGSIYCSVCCQGSLRVRAPTSLRSFHFFKSANVAR